MSNYQKSQDVVERIKAMGRRVESLEKSNPLNNGTIDEGGLIIKGGGIDLHYPTSGRLGSRFGIREDISRSSAPGGIDTLSGLTIFTDETPNNILLSINTWASDDVSFFQVGDSTPDNSLDSITMIANDFTVFSRGRSDLFAVTGDIFIGLDEDNAAGKIVFTNFAGSEGHWECFIPDVQFWNLPGTASAANVRIDPTTAQLQFVTSSIRFKQDVEDFDTLETQMLDIQPKTWRDKEQVRKEPDTEQRYFGAIAEDLDELGLGFLVDYVADGPHSINYDRIAIALIPFIKKQSEEIELLKAEVAILKENS